MNIRELIEAYPEQFPELAEKVLDGYFGTIFVTYRNEKILYVNARMAASVGMTKEEVTGISLAELREKKLWMRSLSKELYEERKAPFNAYNVSKFGQELFTHVEPIYDDQGEVMMGVQYSIPKEMLTEFSGYIDKEKAELQNYKDIAEYLRSHAETNEQLVLDSPAAQQAFHNAKYISPLDSTVLICGETGTGKDVLATYIYRNSKRSGRPFVPVNCSAIPSELVESEFFGYDRGAFTGARSNGKAGLFEMANRGTLFLDEVGELPMAMQAKLLRVLESGEIMRVGGNQVIKTDVRIIAATNRDLKQMVAEGKFREDLYYRLNVMPIYLPPLRERKEDIIPLARQFLSRYNRKYHLNRQLSPEMGQSLMEYSWPGNIRELRNIVERYAISGYLDVSSARARDSSAAVSGDLGLSIEEGTPLHTACALFEQAYISQALEACGGSVTRAAQRLGIHRSLLYKKLKKAEE